MFKKFLIGILGFSAWTLALVGLGQRQEKVHEHEIHSARTWLKSLSQEQSAHILFGSSNIAYSLDCARLDARCADQKLTWYNLGQRGMHGYELLDFIVRFLDPIESASSLKTIYIEATPELWSNRRWNWRNAEVCSVASIIESSIAAVDHSNERWNHWNALESICQGMMMKCVAPLHCMLYPSNAPSRKGTKGFYPPPIQATPWVPNEYEERALLESKNNQDEWSNWRTSGGKFACPNDSMLHEMTYPFDRLHTVVEACRKRNIEVRMLFIPTEPAIHLFDTLASITGNPPIALGLSDDVEPFVTPEWMRDVRHLNARGVEWVSDELGDAICQAKP